MDSLSIAGSFMIIIYERNVDNLIQLTFAIESNTGTESHYIHPTSEYRSAVTVLLAVAAMLIRVLRNRAFRALAIAHLTFPFRGGTGNRTLVAGVAILRLCHSAKPPWVSFIMTVR